METFFEWRLTAPFPMGSIDTPLGDLHQYAASKKRKEKKKKNTHLANPTQQIEHSNEGTSFCKRKQITVV